MAIKYSRTDSIKRAFQPLGTGYDSDAYAELIATTGVGGSTPVEGRILDGTAFAAGDYSAGIAFNTGTNILIQNGVNDGLYILAEILTTIDCSVALFEAPTFSAAGSAITPINLNRVSAKVLGATITKNPTLTTDGTQLGPTILNQSNIKKALFEDAIILAPSTNYLIKITSISSYVGIINILMQLYQPNL